MSKQSIFITAPETVSNKALFCGHCIKPKPLLLLISNIQRLKKNAALGIICLSPPQLPPKIPESNTKYQNARGKRGGRGQPTVV